MPQHADTRYDAALSRRDRWVKIAEGHRAKEAYHDGRGNEGLARLSRVAAEKAERHAKARNREVEGLTLHAARARTARRQNEERGADILQRAVDAAATVPHPVKLTPKEERRQKAEAEKRARMERQAEATRVNQARKAGIDHDPRTAAAQRDLVVSSRRGAESVASFSDYGSLFRRREDRTVPRIAAMERFDELCHRAYAGLFPEPRFERGVDTSKTLPGVPDDRADALLEMQHLTARIGVEAQAILFHRIYQRMTFAWMTSQGMGEAERLGVLFQAGVDGVARFYRIVERSRAVEVMEQQLQPA